MDAVIENLPTYFDGLPRRSCCCSSSGISALVLGTIVGSMRISPVASLRAFATVYTELVRNTPLTLVLFFCAFVLPYLGSRAVSRRGASSALSVYTSPFVAEALRSGINGVPVGQAEAARSVGLGFGQTVSLVSCRRRSG